MLYHVVLPQAKIDSMWDQFGIEEEEYNMAIHTHKLDEDEEVLRWQDELWNP